MARTKRVELFLEMPGASVVSVAGTFNNWDAARNPMRKGRDGLWRCTLWLPTGRHEYRFVVDGAWLSDPKAAASAPNPFGGSNSILEV